MPAEFALTDGPKKPLGASMISDILGVGPYRGQGPWRAWSRIHGLSESRSDNATDRGNIMEDAVADNYRKTESVGLLKGTGWREPGIIGPEPWMSCHPDFLVFPHHPDIAAQTQRQRRGRPLAEVIDIAAPHCQRLLEIKTLRFSFKRPWGKPGTDEIPPGYASQCVWQLACMQRLNPGLDRVDLAVFSTVSDEFRVYTIRRDVNIEERLIAFAREWYQRHIIEGEPPDIDDTEACSRGLSVGLGGGNKSDRWENPTDEDKADARRLYDIKATIKVMQSDARAIQNRLIDRIGNKYGIDGVGIYYPVKRGDRVSRTFRLIYEPEDSDS